MRGHSLAWLASLILSASVSVHATGPTKPPSGTEPEKVLPKKIITATQLDIIDLEGAQNLDKNLKILASQLRLDRRNKSNESIELEALRQLAQYETYESIVIVEARLFAELQKDLTETSLAIIEECLNVLNQILLPNPGVLLARMEQMRDMLDRNFSGLEIEEVEHLSEYAESIIARAQSRGGNAISLADLIEKLYNTPTKVKEDLQEMREFLNRRILGQPEMVDAFMAMEWKNQMYRGSREKPDAIYLMGLPGTGKDTGAEAFTDALWQREKSYEKHMYRLPIMKDKTELWKLLGSATGFVGSDNFPPFLMFLVNHSGGRYLLQKVDKSFAVVQNPEWKGTALAGYNSPDKAVVFANELHNWSKDNKDVFLKQALEKGYFTINNPNGGLSEIYVPVRFVLASNEGIPLITAREANGQRYGKALTYEQMMKKWENIHDNKEALKAEILASNGDVNSRNFGGEALGTSEELLNRISPRFILLLRPLSPDVLKTVVENRLGEIKRRLATESGFFSAVDLTWEQAIIDFVQQYDYVPENNARPIQGNVDALIEETLLRALSDGDIPIQRDKQRVNIHLSIEKNPDSTATLVIRYADGSVAHEIRKPIRMTEKDRPTPALTQERIASLSTLAERLKQRVFGIDEIADRIAGRVLAIENQRTADTEDSRKASVLVALGLSSTGKTELAKALAQQVSGDEKDLVTFDFSQIQTLQDFKTRILGTREGSNPVRSDFMKAYDRANGKLIVAFDELANVRDQNLMTALYDFFREPVISTFSDGKPRKMGGVMVLVTGNAGQELYKNVPRDVPMAQQMAAWEDISKKVTANPELQREILERYFPEPLVNRFGKNNIFFFPPHTFRSLKQLAQLKLAKELKRLSNTTSRHGWNLVVPSAEEYTHLIETIVEEGFSLRYQGAAIDSFVTEDLGEALESLLLRENVPSGSTVVLKVVDKTDNTDEEERGTVNFNLYVEDRNTPIAFKFRRAHEERPMKKNNEEQMITAYHEAGHSIITQVFLSDTTKPGMISILPGVAQIGGDWVVYAGIAHHEIEGLPHLDRDYFLHRIAIWAAGETAERLVTQGESHTAGKSDDMMRATALAQDAILRYGLSPTWGTQAIPTGMSKEDYLAGLSEEKKKLFETEVQNMVQEGAQLARTYLEANFATALIPLGNMLIEKGLVTKEEIREFYANTPIVHNGELSAPSALSRATGKLKSLFSSRGEVQPGASARKLLRKDIVVPNQVADVDGIVEARKRAQFASVPPPAEMPIGTNSSYTASLQAQEGCEALLNAG